MNRYKIPKEDDVIKTNKLRRSTPDVYMRALMDGLGVQCGRFASPLDFHPEMQQYYSMHERDKVFGANTDAYIAPNGKECRKLTLHGHQMTWTRQ